MTVTDCHTHVFLPGDYPFAEARAYTPGRADTGMLENHLAAIGAGRVVVVQPSPYGLDNRATCEAVGRLGQGRARGIAVVDPARCGRDDLAALSRQGIVGCRANLKTSGVASLDVAETYLRALGGAMRGTDMVIQVFLPLSIVLALRPVLAGLGRPVILDHFAGLKTGSPRLREDVAALADLLSLPNMVLKASGGCRVTGYAPDHRALDPVAPALFDAAPGRVIWGTDWPHTGTSSERATRPISEIEPFRVVDDRAGLDDLARWAGSEARRAEILSATPAALFGF